MRNTGGIMRKVGPAFIIAIVIIFFTTAAAAQTTSYVIFASPTSLSFSLPAGSPAVSQSVMVNDTTPGPLPFALAVDRPWITINSASGNTAGGGMVMQFGVNPAGLQPGTYTGHVIITASLVSNSPMAFPISLTITGSSMPSITTQPVSQSVTTGTSATFRVAASGTSPMTFQWKKNGVAISGATFSSYTTPAVTMSENNAAFSVTATNSLGSAQSQNATLTVSQANKNYVIFASPTSLSFSLKAGSAATSQSVKVNDTTPGPLPFALSVDQPWVTINATSGNTAGGGMVMQFGVNPAGLQPGTYTGHVILTASGVSNSPMAFPISLTVTSATTSNSATAPTITTQPANTTVIAGKTASFSVAASGSAPMTYQWNKNGVAISGATSATYTTPAETTADNNAKFTVSVSNSAGSATSNAAVLTVTTATLVLNSSVSSLNFGNVNVSSSATQTVTLTNSGNSNVTISNVTVSGAGFNASGVSSGLILTPGQTASLTATFAPATAGSATGSVSVASNAGNSPDAISLSGMGVAAVNHLVALNWSASTSSVIGYNTYSATVSGGPYTKLTSSPVTATSYTDTAVQSGKTYFFVVTSVDSNNLESAFSSEVSALVP